MGNVAHAATEILLELERGFVKKFFSERGFGFLSIPKQKEDVFIHAKDWHCLENGSLRPWSRSDRKDAPREGDSVVFIRLAGLKASAWAVVPASKE